MYTKNSINIGSKYRQSEFVFSLYLAWHARIRKKKIWGLNATLAGVSAKK